MSEQKQSTIGHAIIWAATMIALSIVFADHENSQMIIFLMLAGWISSQALVQTPGDVFAKKCVLFRRVVTGRKS